MANTLITAAALFALCAPGPRTTCVVDGDTFWLEGEKIRIADINAPETHGARCSFEQKLGDAATARLAVLLNKGPFALEAGARDRDRYGRALRTVTRQGRSLGAELVREGLAEPWKGRRSDWCGAELPGGVREKGPPPPADAALRGNGGGGFQRGTWGDRADLG